MCLWRLPSLHPFSNECFCMTFSQLDQSVDVMNSWIDYIGIVIILQGNILHYIPNVWSIIIFAIRD